MANLTGSTTAVFFVRLSAAVDEIVDVDWSTRDGTAIAGKDYEAASGTVSFLPGETEKAIDVVVYGQDDVSADGKKFYIELKPPVNAVLTDAMAECVITVADEDGVLVTSLVIAQGKRGLKGDPGLSAYEQAVLMGYTGTVEQWMDEIGDASQAAERAESFASQAAESAVIAGQKADEAAEAVISTKQYVDGALASQSAYLDSELANQTQTVNSALASQSAYLDSELANQTQTVNSALSDLSTAANKFYPTLAAANADIANIQVDQPVTIGESANGGLWYKATSGATTLTKSPHDPLTQAKEYADNTKTVSNLTTEKPLATGYYTLYNAVRAVPVSRRRKGQIITFESASKTWDFLQYRGEGASEASWLLLDNWMYLDRPSIFGVARNAIPKQYWGQGLRATRVVAGQTVIEEYVGPTMPTSAQFFLDSNWVRMATHADLAPRDAMAGDAAAQLQGLSTSLFGDASAMSFVNQGVNTATGALNPALNAFRLSTQYLLPFRDIESVEVATGSGWLFMLTELDANESVVAYTTTWVPRKTSFHADTRYIRLMLQKGAGGGTTAEILPTDLPSSGLKIVTRLKSSYEEMRLRDRIGTDYLKTAVVVSDWKNERIAHCSTIVEDLTDTTGTMWAGYYASATDEVETISSNVHCVLLKLNTCDLHSVERFVAMEKGQVVGDWEQDTLYSPYDPVLIVNETNIQYLMVGNNVNDSTGVRMCQRIFDKATETFADEIQTLKIKYSHLGTEYIEDMSMPALNAMVDRLQGRNGSDLGVYPIFSGRIDKANGYYWVYLGSMQTLGTGFQGCILRSVNGVVWEYVSAPDLAYMNVWEGALKVIGQKVYVLIKADNRYRIYYYDLDTGTWFEGPQILYQILSRPFLWHYMGKLYAIYNAPNNITSWGSVNRSSVAISVVDQETLEIIDTQIMKTDAGCHYFSVCDYKGTPYFMYTEDRKKFNINQMKGNISVTPMWFLNV